MIKHMYLVVAAFIAANAFAGGWFVGDGVYVGTVIATNNLSVSNNATIGGDLTVSSTANITNLHVRNNLEVYCQANLFNNLYLQANGGQNTIYAGNLSLTNWLDVNGSADIAGFIDAHSGARFYEVVSFDKEVQFYTSSDDVKFGSWAQIYNNTLSETLPTFVQTTAQFYASAATGSVTLAITLANGNNAAGQSATNFLNIQGTGVVAWGVGTSTTNINPTAFGASQFGYNLGTATIGGTAHGAHQALGNGGTATIGTASFGARQAGYNGGTMLTQTGANGAEQAVENEGYLIIGGAGSMQRGDVASGAAATNYAAGALQLFDLLSGQGALTTSDGDASILLGAGVSSNRNAIVAGDGQVSHGDGSITAGGGFYGPSATLASTLTASNIVQTSGGWDDLLFPITTIYAFGLTDIEYLPQSNSINFKATCNTNFASDNVWLIGQLSHSTKTNSAFIYPHVHFAQSSATATNMFFLRYKRYKTGEQIPTTWNDLPLTNNVFTYSTGTIHQICNGAYIPGPFGISENFDFKIWSRGGEAVQLKFFDIHFQRDSLGSDLEYQKTF